MKPATTGARWEIPKDRGAVTLSVPRGVAMWLANGLACLLDIGENPPRAVGVILSEFSCNDRGA